MPSTLISSEVTAMSGHLDAEFQKGKHDRVAVHADVSITTLHNLFFRLLSVF